MEKQIADLPDIVSRDEAYQNAMRYSDKQNARAERLIRDVTPYMPEGSLV